jgi:diguanylate cyclase (GGDEF)-like protein/PAS domain S-box-containing protein
VRRVAVLKRRLSLMLLGHRLGERISPAIYGQLVARLYDTRPVALGLTGLGLGLVASLATARANDPLLGLLTAAACIAVAFVAIELKAGCPESVLLDPAAARRAERRIARLSVASSGFVGALCARGLLASNDAFVHLMLFSVGIAATISVMRNHSRPRIVYAQLAALSLPSSAALAVLGSTYWLLMAGSWILTYLTVQTTKSLYRGVRDNLLKDEQLQRQSIRFEAALDNMAQGLCMFDAQARVVVANRRYLEIYGFSADAVHAGTSLRDLLAHSIEVGNHRGESLDDLVDGFTRKFAAGEPESFHNALTNGRTIAVSYEPMAGGGWVTTHEDITDRKAAEARIAYLARHDSLTRLANRVVFREALEAALPRAARGEPIAVLCVDLDRFKTVNDTLGHGVGDELLKQASDRLRKAVRETDLVARLGGDEFAVIQLGSPQPTGATLLADRLIESLGAPFEVDGQILNIGCSVGVSIGPDDGCDPDQLLRNADLALYRAKTEGRGQHRFFASDMDERMQARRRLELELRAALVAGQFELAFQPLITVETGGISGFEALLRWQHPERGLVLPDEFIPLAEEIGLIVPLGEWVLREACATAAGWPDQIRVAVNLSPTQFRAGNLVGTVVSALSAAGLAPNRLELEITEGVLLANSDETLKVLHALRGLGVRIAMDDFGTGYSSLSYLRSFPFDKIKIDRSFVRDIDADPEAMAIVRAVTGLGRSLGMATTAEGIETEEQLARLRADGCTEVQGYLLGRPMPARDAARLVRKRQAKRAAA